MIPRKFDLIVTNSPFLNYEDVVDELLRLMRVLHLH